MRKPVGVVPHTGDVQEELCVSAGASLCRETGANHGGRGSLSPGTGPTEDEDMLEAPRGDVTNPVPTPDSAKPLMLRWGGYVLRTSPAEKCQDSHQLSQASDSWGRGSVSHGRAAGEPGAWLRDTTLDTAALSLGGVDGAGAHLLLRPSPLVDPGTSDPQKTSPCFSLSSLVENRNAGTRVAQTHTHKPLVPRSPCARHPCGDHVDGLTG